MPRDNSAPLKVSRCTRRLAITAGLKPGTIREIFTRKVSRYPERQRGGEEEGDSERAASAMKIL